MDFFGFCDGFGGGDGTWKGYGVRVTHSCQPITRAPLILAGAISAAHMGTVAAVRVSGGKICRFLFFTQSSLKPESLAHL